MLPAKLNPDQTQPDKLVYFVRHGQSEGNVLPVFQAADSPLTKKGKEQAKLVARRVAKLKFELLISSSFSRARETAEEIAKKTKKKLELSDLFGERRKPTDLFGREHSDDSALKLYDQWIESLYSSGKHAKDGENFEDIVKRADQALEFLHQQKQKNIVVVTHGFFLKTMLDRAVFGEQLNPQIYRCWQENISAGNAGISILKHYDTSKGAKWRLSVYNDQAHLAD